MLLTMFFSYCMADSLVIFDLIACPPVFRARLFVAGPTEFLP